MDRVLAIAESAPRRDFLRRAAADGDGRAVDACAGGHHALVMARNARPDVVVIQLPLRLLSAEATVQALRMEHGEGLPVVALAPAGRGDLAAGLQPCLMLEGPIEQHEIAAAVTAGLSDARNASKPPLPGRRCHPAPAPPTLRAG